MLKSSIHDFKNYKRDTDYQAEIDKAVSEGDYYSAAVNEQYRNTKIEMEGLQDKYEPTYKYLDYINSDGTKNEKTVVEDTGNQTKAKTTKATNPVPNDYLGMYNNVTTSTNDNF